MPSSCDNENGHDKMKIQTLSLLLLLALVATTTAVAGRPTASTKESSSPSPAESVCDSEGETCANPLVVRELLNSAFVFVKPHANTPATRSMVEEKLKTAGIKILGEKEIDGETIDSKRLIDRHYYAIASKATILPASEMPVPQEDFQRWSGEPWEKVLNEGRACNALEACERFGCTPAQLNDAWQSVPDADMIKLGGGFYCARITMDKSIAGQSASLSLYVFNAFFMSMREKFVGPDKSIHCYLVEWEPSSLSWSDFRHNILGPTNPADAPPGSIRRTILDNFDSLGLTSKPNKGDNGVHASASPFEGLVEKANWLGNDVSDDAFGQALINSGLPKSIIEEWSTDPQVIIDPTGEMGSIFDCLEDMDVADCFEKIIHLSKLLP